MAVTRTLNTIRITADNDTVTGPANICAIGYVAGTVSPTASMKMTSTSGAQLWAANATISDVYVAKIRAINGDILFFDLAGTGTEVILYLE